MSQKGWVYFYSSSLQVVTNQDIRDPDILELVNRTTANYPLPNLNDEMEVQLLVQTHLRHLGAPNLFLVINHKHCVASYDLREVKHDNVHLLDANTCKHFNLVLFTNLMCVLVNRRRRLYWVSFCIFHGKRCRSHNNNAPELSLEPSSTRTDTRQGHPRRL